MTINLKKYADELLFIPLGGANEIGMNLNLYQYKGKWLIVDFGIGFSGTWLPGVDIMVPDISFLKTIKDDILGMIITHAHEDHIGAIPYLWEEIGCPIYASPFAATLINLKLKSEGIRGAKIIDINENWSAKLGDFELEMAGITHSIPEMNAMSIKAGEVVVFHTGDWKIDPTPLVGITTEHEKITRMGDSGVSAIVCDSTNVFVSGRAGSEAGVRDNLVKAVASCKGRVAVATFASNVARLESIIYAATQAGRKVALAGRSLYRIAETCKEAGYLQDVEFLNDNEGMKLPPEKVLFICTGCQGESRAAVSRIARGEHPAVKFVPNDTVIFSSRVIPGNELAINHVLNNLVRRGIEIISANMVDIHVSGHPAQDELKEMYDMVRPKIALPVHGEARHLHHHAKLARSWGVPQALELQNGVVVRIGKEEAEIIGLVESGYLAIDGKSVISTKSSIIKNRKRLQESGVLFISFAVEDNFELASEISISAPGLLDDEEDMDLIEEYKAEIEKILEMPRKNMKSASGEIRDSIRKKLRKMIEIELDKRPMIEIHIHML